MTRPSPAPAVLLVAVLLLGAAGCVAGTVGSPGPADELDGEVALVARAVAISTDLERAIDSASRRYPRLRGQLAPLAGLHATHRRVLAGALPDGASPAPGAGRPLVPTSGPSQARSLLQQRERRGARSLTRLVVRAQSGPLARLLASMAASTAQVRVALGGQPAEGVGTARGPGGPGTTGARTDLAARSAEGSVTALQDALAAEHAALWLAGVLGARTSAAGAPSTFVAIEAAYDAHRARRDGLEAQLRALGAGPVAAKPTYRFPARASTLSAVRGLGRHLERTTAGWWSALVASSVGPLRRDAADALRDAAVRELAFGGRPQAFPGAAELRDR